MKIIRNRRDINVIERFRKPEYWPYTQGESISNQAQYDTYDIYEPFNDPNPFTDSTFKVVSTATDNFEDSSLSASQWTSLETDPSATISYVADDSGMRSGLCRKITHSSSTSGIVSYAAALNGVDVTNIRSGRLSFYHRYTAGADGPKWIFRAKDSTLPPTNYYSVNRADTFGYFTYNKTGEAEAGPGMGSGNEGIDIGIWRFIEVEWREKHWLDYGEILHIQLRIDGIPYYTGRNTTMITPYGFDEAPSYPGGTGSDTTYIMIQSLASGPSTAWYDNVKIERFAPDYVVESGA